MGQFRDSVGNTYDRIVHGGPPTHSAKPSKKRSMVRSANARRQRKYNRYRDQVGKPNGPGQPGNKSGANKLR